MNIFEQSDYKAAIRAFVASLPGSGHGELGRIARAARIHPTLVSQILNGTKQLTSEQACLVAKHMGLNDLETEFFLSQVEFERAGSELLKHRIRKRLDSLQAARQEIKSRLPKADKTLSEKEQAIFYSDWFSSAVRLLSSVPGFDDPESIAVRLGLPRSTVTAVVAFLLESGLCVREGEGLRIGPKRTHLEKESPFIRSHHRNWRMRSMQKMDTGDSDDLFFSAPLTLSREDFDRLKKEIVDLIARVGAVVDSSPAEELYCFNADFFKV